MGLPRASSGVWVLDFVSERYHRMSPGDCEGMFIKARDSKTRKEGPSIEEATEEARPGCLGSLGSQRKGDLGDRFQGSAWDKLPDAHCLRV